MRTGTGRPAAHVLLAMLALLLVAGCGDANEERAPDEASIELTDADPDTTFVLEYREGAVLGGPQRLRAESGDVVRMTVESDVDEEVHVHGVDVTIAVNGGESASSTFEAPEPGAYEVELHESGALLGTLEVR